MPKQQTILPPRAFANASELTDALAPLLVRGWLTKPQLASIVVAARPHLPASVCVDMRSPKGVAYVQAQTGALIHMLRVSPRAKIQLA